MIAAFNQVCLTLDLRFRFIGNVLKIRSEIIISTEVRCIDKTPTLMLTTTFMVDLAHFVFYLFIGDNTPSQQAPELLV